MSDAEDFHPTADIETLRQRARVIARIRRFFDSREFFEVQSPALSHDTIVDQHIDPLVVAMKLPGQSVDSYYLQTSPEFAMKRLLAAGADAIYQIGPAFRAGEIGQLHNIEFTMLEWYRVGDSYQKGIRLLDDLAQEVLGCQTAERMTYFDAMKRFGEFDLLSANRNDEFEKLRFALNREFTILEFLNETWVQKVEPALKQFRSIIIYDWPADQAALARVRVDETGHSVAERFELYVDGIELANGYHELTDAEELMKRNKAVNEKRVAAGKNLLPVKSRLLDAMRHGLPQSCGVALGVDRLVMLALGKKTICDVMAFNSHRA